MKHHRTRNFTRGQRHIRGTRVDTVSICRYGDGWVVDIYDHNQDPLMVRYFSDRHDADTFANQFDRPIHLTT